MINFEPSMPVMLLPAITFLMISFGTRFTVISNLIRKIHDESSEKTITKTKDYRNRINSEISASFLTIINSIDSEVEVLMNIDTSRTLLTLLLFIEIILSFFCKPASYAGLSGKTSSITAGVMSLPTETLIIVKIIIASKKFAKGPAATIIDL